MTDVLVGAKIQSGDWPATVSDADPTDILNISSTSFIEGTPVVAVTFTAPTSGKVLITVSSGASDSTVGGRVIVAPNVFLGTNSSGTEVLGTTNTLATERTTPQQATDYTYASRTSLLTGLTAGSTYYARLVYKVSGATTADISYRDIMVRPVP